MTPAGSVIVPVRSSGGDYDIVIAPSLLDRIGQLVADATGGGHIALVTDATVDAVYGARVADALAAADLRVDRFAVPPGESSKSWGQAGRLLEQFAEARLDRGSTVVALGGGVIGDLAGFCAATFMRGVRLIHVPTTLLAQVDSSIGGKTAVDLPQGKNLAGAFWSPIAVFSDTATLGTLHEREWSSGLAEVAKTGVLAGGAFFEWLEKNTRVVRSRSTGAADRIVRESAQFKASIVSTDEREGGVRECLNYGHTFGHAIEMVSGYRGILHGEAVAEGMRFAATLAVELGVSDAAWAARQDEMLDGLGLGRIAVPNAPGDLLSAMTADKKSRSGAVRFVLSSGAGEWSVQTIDPEVLARVVERWTAQSVRKG